MTADTAATAALSPGPAPGPGSGATADDTAPTRAHFRAWERQLAAEHLLAPDPAPRPHRRDRPGHRRTRPVYGQASVACGNRRETVCPACSQVYKRDARQLVRAGLAGGKGIPETITAHPCVFATLTAPSFGPVHARRMRGKTVLPCRPRRDAKARRCPHGRDISCPTRHLEDDPRLGQPHVPRLLRLHRRRAVQRLRGRPVAPVHHLPAPPPGPPGRASPRRRCARQLRIRFVKVAEYQARGVVHFHAVIRLDAPGEDYQPPPARLSPPTCCATPSARPPLPPRSPSSHDGTRP